MSIEILMPALSPTMEEGTLAKWFVSVGDTVESGDLLAEIETDKATMEFEAVEDGKVESLMVEAGSQNVKVNTVIAILSSDEDQSASKPPVKKTNTEPTQLSVASKQHLVEPVKSEGNRIFASPLARRLASEKGIDLSLIKGSGPHNRIVKADIVGNTKIETTKPPFPSKQEQIAPSVVTEIKLDGMRRTVAARLTESKQTVPHFYLRRDIQIDKLMRIRKEINEVLSQNGQKISVNDFIIKACAKALIQNPTANVTWAGDKILQYKDADIAVAVAVEGGLFTPVIKAAQTRTLSELSDQMKDLATRAKTRRLAPEEYTGGSFSISNLGMFGIDNFDAVINPPHGAILAVGAGKKRPIVNNEGDLVSATVMSVTLSVDHRSIDGALGAVLLNSIVENLENPLSLLV